MDMEYEKMDTSFETIFGEVQVVEFKPEGTIEITENGLHDVSEYANAEVNVIGEGGITPTGTKEITENGEYDVSTYETANVNVPIPDGYIQPAGTLEITENGKYDVTQYAEAEVTVEASGGGGVGIILSDFTGEGYNLPRKADCSNFPPITENDFFNRSTDRFCSLFANGSTANGNGFYLFLEEVKLPKLRAFSTTMFSNCVRLKTITGDFTELTQVGNSAFKSCTALTDLPYMPNLENISGNAFNGCTGLTNVKFYNTLKTTQSTIFSGCTNLLDIYVPWAEGEVANAPWGATNATIHYNTVYDENHNPIV